MPAPRDNRWDQYTRRFKTWPESPLFSIEDQPSAIVCIPAYAEADLCLTLESLMNASLPATSIAVFILFNADKRMTPVDRHIHDDSIRQCKSWIEQQDTSRLKILDAQIDAPGHLKWGVGWARKIVMDEAARVLGDDGIIICLDGDCTIQTDYFTSVVDHFTSNRDCDAASIYFEHRWENLQPTHRHAIVKYELHLRYLEWAKQWAGHPFAGYTIGSAMAVRRSAYLQQGGMNTRMAGEDFYFLQKYMEIGTWASITGTAVYPSSRQSYRVPFGTGRAMKAILDQSADWKTIAFDNYRMIKPLLVAIDHVYAFINVEHQDQFFILLSQSLQLDPRVIDYLQRIGFYENVRNIKQHTSSIDAFIKRFFRYFNSFALIKYLHYMREHHFPDVPVGDAVNALMSASGWNIAASGDEESMLAYIRMLDKKQMPDAKK